MTYIANAFTAGQTLTAAQMEAIRDSTNAGHNVFTNEAARDAAITAPTKGMMAYLTTPTVPAATGGITAVPSGVLTMYTGSVWMCITPISSGSNTNGSTTAGYATTLTGDGTAVSVTLVTGTLARVSYTATTYNSAGGNYNYTTVSVSGATTVGAVDTYASITTAPTGVGYYMTHARDLTLGITAGTNTFTLNYKTSAGTANWVYRNLTVVSIA